jgi:hypothetical protein
MDKRTLEEELDLFVHQQNRLRFQKLIDETTDVERLTQLTKLQAEGESNDRLPPSLGG